MPTVLDTLVTRLVFQGDMKALENVDKRVRSVTERLDGFGRGMTTLGTRMTVMGAGVLGAFGLTVRAASDWESAFTGVRKTVNATEEEFARLDQRFREMALNEVPIDVNELAGLGEEAGQLGVATDYIDDFVATTAKLRVTTNLGDQAGTSLARMMNIMGTSQGDVDRMGSSIVDLGNNLATTEAEIATISTRIAPLAKLVGINEAAMLAWGGAASSVGVEAEMGGTAIGRMWADMDAAVQSGTKELTVFAETAGMSREEFAAMFKRDASTAALRFLMGLESMRAAGANVHTVLEAVGFDSVRLRQTALSLASANQLLEGAIDRSNRAWGENTALTKEAELRFATTESKGNCVAKSASATG